ncbi:uncharacterized protein UV8b_02589 [Ustilaginoidea virens]|uniref:Uncharacterized protein n=1 Tax=Ustilaginoidea virens TaxID=1159556 RepID=A0A8E5MFF3_USTVR|nr:uncharacterized protein UV8b_02589 [Ustilaginoidea virens]QUC18348.1 hypothetical protein UV8b_02589 [Ustilaginoidea virens]
MARSRMLKFYMSCLGRWAGKRLLGVGDYMRHDHYPPGLFESDQEKQDLLLRKARGSGDEAESDEEAKRTANGKARETRKKPSRRASSRTNQPATRAWSKCGEKTKLEILIEGVDRYEDDEDDEDAMLTRRLRYETMAEFYRDLSSWSVWKASRLYDMKLDDLYPADEVWILRNLTAKEMVRGDRFEQTPGSPPRGPFLEHQGLGTAVLSRICWTSDPSISMEDPGGRISRGVWAGHGFDIATLKRHEEALAAGEIWRDVSAEVVAEVESMWRANRCDEE